MDPTGGILKPEDDPKGSTKEKPLLIDPATENAVDHIQFRPGLRGRWEPHPRKGSNKGDWTIKVCGLKRPGLLDLYKDHVDCNVIPRVNEIQQAIQGGAGIETAWSRALDNLLGPQMVLAALSYDVLDYKFPSAMRDKFNLDLPIPGS